MDFHTVLTLTVMEALLTMDDTVVIMVVITEEVDHHHHHQKVPPTKRAPLLPTTRRMAPQPPRRANHHLEQLAKVPLTDAAADADPKENTVMDMDLAEESAEVTDLEVAEDLEDMEDTAEAQTVIVEALMDTVAHYGLVVAFPLADVDSVDSVTSSITNLVARLERRTSYPRPMSSTPNHPTSYIFPFQGPRRKMLASLGIRRRAN